MMRGDSISPGIPSSTLPNYPEEALASGKKSFSHSRHHPFAFPFTMLLEGSGETSLGDGKVGSAKRFPNSFAIEIKSCIVTA
jgi:hypothetical protein